VIIFELIVWGFSTYIAGCLLLLMVSELCGNVKTHNDDVEYLVKARLREDDTSSSFNPRYAIKDPFNFKD
tara:strand:- start:1419 stop:1628 length:210 start_codon:yes stop_codon:yes gene_type:complete